MRLCLWACLRLMDTVMKVSCYGALVSRERMTCARERYDARASLPRRRPGARIFGGDSREMSPGGGLGKGARVLYDVLPVKLVLRSPYG